MTDYTTLSNTAVGVGGLPSGATVTALRDNPIAIAEGAAGAPRIYGLAAATQLEYLTLYPFTGVGAGNSTLTSLAYSGSFSTTVNTTTTYITAGTVTVTALATGTFRFTARLGDYLGNPYDTIARILKNGVEVQEWDTGAGGNVTATVDIAAADGDTFEWQVKRGGTGQGTIKDQAIKIDDSLTTVALPVKTSEL